jgi:hypothetical protein
MKLIKLLAHSIIFMPLSITAFKNPRELFRSQQEELGQHTRHPIKRDDMDRTEFEQLIQQEKLKREKQREYEIKRDAAALAATVKP